MARYREFIHRCVLRSPRDFASTHYRPTVAAPHPRVTSGGGSSSGGERGHGELTAARVLPPDLVVYLRLGDKAAAGDTIITFNSGYYQAVLSKIRPQHDACWIVTGSVQDPRAQALAYVAARSSENKKHPGSLSSMCL